MTNIASIPYDARSDEEKIQSQWVKLTGLHDRTDWSAAVVRAATAAKLAVNLAIRREFSARSDFDAAFVDHLLKWANGLSGKIRNVLMPLLAGDPKHDAVEKLTELARRINGRRNDIAHRGAFCYEEPSTALIADCRAFVHGIVQLYEPEFTLKDSARRGGRPPGKRR